MPATNQLEDDAPACPRPFLDLPIPAVFQLFVLAVLSEAMALPAPEIQTANFTPAH